MTKITLIGWLLTLIGCHLCIYFSSWSHHEGDTYFLVTLMDTFLVGAVTGSLSAMWVDGVFDE